MTSTKSFTKRFMAILLAILTVVSTFSFSALTAQAATSTAFTLASNSKPVKSYIISTSNIPCYTSSNLGTRGTVTAGKSSTAYIAPSDDVYIIQVDTSNLKWAKVTFPVGNKRYTAYIALSKLTANNSDHKKTTASAKVMTYKRANTNTGSSSMYISKGETVYRVATSGNYCQVVYPCSGGWRMAWVTLSNYNSYLTDGGHKHNYSISGYEAAHPHKQYKKCSCGAYYYTGTTQKMSSCKTCYPTYRTMSSVENNVSYKYTTVNLDTSSQENWIKSLKNAENTVCNNGKGIIVACEITNEKSVYWKVPKSSVYAGPRITGNITQKYTVPSTIQYKVHTHTQNRGFGKNWYYSNGSIIALYTCNCGYRKELMEWTIPLPDVSDAYTSKKVVQGLPKINH